MGANSKTAYRQCIKVGPDATLQKILGIYRNEAAVQAHFQTRQNSQSMVHQINTQYPPLREGEEEDVHKLYNSQKRRYNQNAKALIPEKQSQYRESMSLVWRQPQAMGMSSIW